MTEASQSPSPNERLTFEEALAVHTRGENLATYRAKALLRQQLSDESDQYRNLPPHEWPEIFFNWDLTREGQRFSLDGVQSEEFDRQWPEGFVLGWVDVAVFDSKLCHFSRRDSLEELWKLGSATNLAYLIAYLHHGHPISPPLVKPLPDDEVIFQGGHHRYAVVKATKQEQLPIYVLPEFVAATSAILSVRWA